MSDLHRSHRWRKARAEVLARSRLCWVCGHDGAGEVDHRVPLSAGGAAFDPLNLAPAHGTSCPCPTCGRACNQSKWSRERYHPTRSEAPQSRAW